jgi:serine/threonine protein kinase
VALDSDYTPKFIDWGLSRYHAEPKIIGGTKGYIYPYYIKTRTYGAVSDIFSFGIVILEIISGRLQSQVYDGRYDIRQHLNNYREFGDQNRRPCPEQLVTKLMRIAIKCTADKIEERFHSMSEVIADLLVVEKENVVLEHFEQETEKRIMQQQDQVENLSLQRDLQNRIRFMRDVYNRIEESANMKICCHECCQSETPVLPAD